MNAFDPEEWLEVAEVCCDRIPGVDGEALLRTALNRAYYAALLAMRERIEQVHGAGVVPRARTHAAILKAVKSGGGRFSRIFYALQRLRELREGADYVLRSPPLVWSTVHSQVVNSRSLIRKDIKALPDADIRRLKIPRS
jgi:hypothetical protein